MEKYTCLEATLEASKTDAWYAELLRMNHEKIAEGRTTFGWPEPMVECPRLKCGRDRFVRFVGGGVLADEDTENPRPCLMGVPMTVVSDLPPYAMPPQPPEDDNPPQPPPPALAA